MMTRTTKIIFKIAEELNGYKIKNDNLYQYKFQVWYRLDPNMVADIIYTQNLSILIELKLMCEANSKLVTIDHKVKAINQYECIISSLKSVMQMMKEKYKTNISNYF